MIEKKYEISIILPIYNGEPYLLESVQSVLSQSFGSFEFLILNDGSTDRTPTILRSFADERIKIFEHRSCKGLFPSLNDLIRQARTPLVRLWSHDDRMKPDCLEREYQFWLKHQDVGMFYCHRDIIDERGCLTKHAWKDSTPDLVPSRLADEISFNWGCMPGNIANITVPRKIFNEMGLFDETLKQAADFDMWVRIQKKYPIGFCREVLMELRRHKRQLSRNRGAELVFMREGEAVYKKLEARLPNEIMKFHKPYVRFVRHTAYFHSAVKAMLQGEWNYGFEILKELRKLDNIFSVFVFWLITGNLHFYRPKPIFTSVENSKPKQ